MASGEITGASEEELQRLRRDFTGTPPDKAGIPFEVVYCLTEIAKQPDDYDGPTRYCKNYAANLTEDEWDEQYDDPFDSDDPRSKHPACRFHGRSCNSQSPDHLDQGMAGMTHGMYAENHRLRADFSEADAKLFDWILSWADIYGWPPEEEDPARYDLLEQFAYDRVRSVRAERYFEDVAEENDGQSEVEYRDIRDDEGVVVGEVPVPNTLAEELRLLRKDLRNQMKELGLTPKSRGEMDLMESEADANEAVAEIASDALDGDHEYDPSRFGPDADTDEGVEESDG